MTPQTRLCALCGFPTKTVFWGVPLCLVTLGGSKRLCKHEWAEFEIAARMEQITEAARAVYFKYSKERVARSTQGPEILTAGLRVERENEN